MIFKARLRTFKDNYQLKPTISFPGCGCPRENAFKVLSGSWEYHIPQTTPRQSINIKVFCLSVSRLIIRTQVRFNALYAVHMIIDKNIFQDKISTKLLVARPVSSWGQLGQCKFVLKSILRKMGIFEREYYQVTGSGPNPCLQLTQGSSGFSTLRGRNFSYREGVGVCERRPRGY